MIVVPRIALDPGTRSLGWAAGGRELAACGASRTTARTPRDQALRHYEQIPYKLAHRVALEIMHYDGRRATTPGDLLSVQAVGAFVAGRLGGEPAWYLPHEWTSVPKDIGNERLGDVLTAPEREIVRDAIARTPKESHKEVLDAVRIFLYDAGRADKGGSKHA